MPYDIGRPFIPDKWGRPSKKDLELGHTNYGKRKLVGVIRNGVYCNPETGEPITLSDEKKEFNLRIGEIGGIDW